MAGNECDLCTTFADLQEDTFLGNVKREWHNSRMTMPVEQTESCYDAYECPTTQPGTSTTSRPE